MKRRLPTAAASAAAVCALAACALAAGPAHAGEAPSPVPTPSPSALASVGPTDGMPSGASGAPAGSPGSSGSGALVLPLGHLTDEIVAPVLERLFLTVALVITPDAGSAAGGQPGQPGSGQPGSGQPGSGAPQSAASLQPGGGSSTDGQDWHPKGAIKIPTAAPLPPRSKRSPVLTKEQIIWAAYVSAANAAPTRCHIPVMLLAAIGEVESSSLRGRSLDSRHDAVPPVRGPILSGGSYPAIHDTDGGRLDGSPVWDRAVGPMQFIPGTWRIWGADGNGDGVADPQNIEDATLAAARYLCASGRDLSRPGDLRTAVLSYNHSQRYVATVLGIVAAVTSGADAGP